MSDAYEGEEEEDDAEEAQDHQYSPDEPQIDEERQEHIQITEEQQQIEVEEEQVEEDDDEEMLGNQPEEEDENMGEMDIKSDDLETIAVLYDQIRGVRKQINPDGDKDLADDFDQHLKTVMFDLSDQVKSPDAQHIKNANTLRAKMLLYEICFTKAREYLQMTNQEVGDIFAKL